MIRLHTCSATWVRIGVHPCYRVERALAEQGIPFERVVHPHSRRKRQDVVAWTGQSRYPVIELDDGSFYREDSKQMAAAIRSGELG